MYTQACNNIERNVICEKSNVFSRTINRILVYLLVYQCYMRRTGCDYVSVIVDMITHYYLVNNKLLSKYKYMITHTYTRTVISSRIYNETPLSSLYIYRNNRLPAIKFERVSRMTFYKLLQPAISNSLSNYPSLCIRIY